MQSLFLVCPKDVMQRGAAESLNQWLCSYPQGSQSVGCLYTVIYLPGTTLDSDGFSTLSALTPGRYGGLNLIEKFWCAAASRQIREALTAGPFAGALHIYMQTLRRHINTVVPCWELLLHHGVAKNIQTSTHLKQSDCWPTVQPSLNDVPINQRAG